MTLLLNRRVQADRSVFILFDIHNLKTPVLALDILNDFC